MYNVMGLGLGMIIEYWIGTCCWKFQNLFYFFTSGFLLGCYSCIVLIRLILCFFWFLLLWFVLGKLLEYFFVCICICVCGVARAFVFVCWRLRALISHWYPQKNFVQCLFIYAWCYLGSLASLLFWKQTN